MNMVMHVSFPREYLMRPLWHSQITLLSAINAYLCFMIVFIVMLLIFLRAMWPFPVLSQFPLLWRSLIPRAFSSCQDWHPGRRGFSLWHCSSGRGTRQASSWPLSSLSRRARSGCIWTTPDFDYRSVKLMGLTWSSVQVRLTNEFSKFLQIVKCYDFGQKIFVNVMGHWKYPFMVWKNGCYNPETVGTVNTVKVQCLIYPAYSVRVGKLQQFSF